MPVLPRIMKGLGGILNTYYRLKLEIVRKTEACLIGTLWLLSWVFGLPYAQPNTAMRVKPAHPLRPRGVFSTPRRLYCKWRANRSKDFITKERILLDIHHLFSLGMLTYINIFFSTTKSSIAEMLLKHWLVVIKNMAPILGERQIVIVRN